MYKLNILIDNSSYHLRNFGDIAMLQIAVERLHKLWPNALIEVITDAPRRLDLFCPGARPLSPKGRQSLIRYANIFRRVHNIVPSKVYLQFLKLEIVFKFRQLYSLYYFIRRRKRLGTIFDKEFDVFLSKIIKADLVIATGGGYLTDAFQGHGIAVLSVLEMAAKCGKITAMFGQGLGPIKSDNLKKESKISSF